MRWEPNRATTATTPAAGHVPAPFWIAVKRGLTNRCPYCGVGKVF